jgi:hypothetical protein
VKQWTGARLYNQDLGATLNLEEAITVLPTPAALVARDTRRADQVSEEIKKLDGLTQHSTFDQADLFSEVKHQAHWATRGFETIEEYYKSLGVDKSKREILYLVRMSEVLATLGTSRELAVAAKVSKLRLIAQLDPAAEVVDEDTEVAEPMAAIMRRLILAAPQTSLAELKQIVDDLLGKGDEDDEDSLTWLNLPIRRDAKQVVEAAIELARSLSGDTIDVASGELKDISTATALERISADFLASPSNQLEELGTPGQYEDNVADGNDFSEDVEEV